MSTKTSLYQLMNHPFYLTVTKFIEANNFKIAKTTVRESLKKVEGTFNLAKLHELLTTFFSDLLTIQIDSKVDNLDYILTPCFLIQAKDNQFFIDVVLKIDDQKALLFNADKKEYTISTDEFQQLLKGSIIILKEEETYHPSKKILEEYNKEQEENKEYIKDIKVIDNFVSEKECQKIISFCEDSNLFQRSKIGSNSGTTISNHRTSSSAMMEIDKTTPIIFNLKQKIAAFLECNLNKIEKLQCVRYYKTEAYKPHFDAYVKKRKYTCLLYLNNGFLGGETYFPEIDFGVVPKTGRLLIFKNLDDNDDVIIQSFHQGSQVTNGVKYACNIWIEN